MDPILCRLPDKILLTTSRSTVPLDRAASCSYKVVNLRQLDDESIVVVFEERLCLQSCGEGRLQEPLRLLVVLFDDLLEPGVV